MNLRYVREFCLTKTENNFWETYNFIHMKGNFSFSHSKAVTCLQTGGYKMYVTNELWNVDP